MIKHKNINKVNVHDIFNKNFKHLCKSIFSKENNKRYGCKIIAITNFILGNCYSNYKNNTKSRKWTQHDGSKINLDPNETILTFKTIKEKLNIDVSDEWIRQIIIKMQNKGILVHKKILGTVYWVFRLSKIMINSFFKQAKALFLEFKQVYDEKEYSNKIFNLPNQHQVIEDPPDDLETKEIEW